MPTAAGAAEPPGCLAWPAERARGVLRGRDVAHRSDVPRKGAARDLDGIPKTGAPSAYRRNTASGVRAPRTALLVSLVLALLLGALSGLVMYPAAQHLRSLRDGERAQATLLTRGGCLVGECRVEFEADGRSVVAELPVGSGGGKDSVGTRLMVRYRADDPRVAVREEDLDGGGAAVLMVLSGGFALLSLVASVVVAVSVARQRRAGPVPGRTPRGGRRHGGDQGGTPACRIRRTRTAGGRLAAGPRRTRPRPALSCRAGAPREPGAGRGGRARPVFRCPPGRPGGGTSPE